jgi:transposase
MRRGHTYGTLLVDLERHRPVDLLPDRTADTLAAWLRTHPGVTILSRDRSTEYARGATLGAPDAQHVLDRWHLIRNLREALERLLDRLHQRLAAMLTVHQPAHQRCRLRPAPSAARRPITSPAKNGEHAG